MSGREVEVVTVFTPRPPEEKWRPYLPLIQMQRFSAEKFGHKHTVMSDYFDFRYVHIKTEFPTGLMPAMIVGVIARLAMRGEQDLVFVDVDCLIGRDLKDAFVGDEMFDLRLTRRPNVNCPINNGAMYVRNEGMARAKFFFERALEMCGEHWGADQEAISMAAAPVPDGPMMSVRHGCKIKFEDMKPYNVVPKESGVQHGKHGIAPFVIHFKGDAKKWMIDYAKRFILTSKESESGLRGLDHGHVAD